MACIGLFLFAIPVFIVLVIQVHFIIALLFLVLYFCGIGMVIFKSKREQLEVQKAVHFNLSLFVKNENNRLYGRKKLKWRPGFLSKWVELHWSPSILD